MKNYFLAAMLTGLILATAGCDSPGGQTPPPQTPPAGQETQKTADDKQPPKEEPKEITVRLYYPNDDGTKLLPTERRIQLNGQDRYTAAVNALIANGQGRYTIIPKQTKVNGVTVKNGTAKVDFSADLQKYFVGGSTGEEMLVGSVVNTLTEFPEITAVEFYSDGKKIETIAGHSDLSVPTKRMDELLQ